MEYSGNYDNISSRNVLMKHNYCSKPNSMKASKGTNSDCISHRATSGIGLSLRNASKGMGFGD